jgi:hypothetical protein
MYIQISGIDLQELHSNYMKIKKFTNFVAENFKGYDSLAEYIEYLAKNNDYAKNVISEYTKGLDPSVRVASIINTLDEDTQKIILKKIQQENAPSEPVEVTPSTYLRYDESNQTGGKNIFKCFLKVTSALGQKNCEVNWQRVPDDYLILYITDSLDVEQTKNVMSRYLYFDKFIKSYTSQTANLNLYYGIKSDMNVDYGIVMDGKQIPLGQFLLTHGTYNFILTLDLKSAQNLKKFLVSLDLNRLNILSKIKSTMKDYFPGDSDSKIKPTIQNEIISYGFQGLGKWDNDRLDQGEIENIKNNFRQFIIQYRWSENIQFNVSVVENWVFINLKIK